MTLGTLLFFEQKTAREPPAVEILFKEEIFTKEQKAKDLQPSWIG
jgi:hypothetical protein